MKDLTGKENSFHYKWKLSSIHNGNFLPSATEQYSDTFFRLNPQYIKELYRPLLVRPMRSLHLLLIATVGNPLPSRETV